MPDIESALTPTQLVERFAKAGIQISERTLRQKARQIGAYRLIGNTMFLMPEDVEALLEASRPTAKAPAAQASGWTDADTDKLIDRLTTKNNKSAKAGKGKSGFPFEPSIESDYEKLLRMREKSSSKVKR